MQAVLLGYVQPFLLVPVQLQLAAAVINWNYSCFQLWNCNGGGRVSCYENWWPSLPSLFSLVLVGGLPGERPLLIDTILLSSKYAILIVIHIFSSMFIFFLINLFLSVNVPSLFNYNSCSPIGKVTSHVKSQKNNYWICDWEWRSLPEMWMIASVS